MKAVQIKTRIHNTTYTHDRDRETGIEGERKGLVIFDGIGSTWVTFAYILTVSMCKGFILQTISS